MAPKQRVPKKANDGEPKKTREVLTLQQKLQVLEHLQTMSVAQVARKWNKNESSIRAIKQRKSEIFRNICDSPSIAKMVFQVRDKTLVRTESALKDWLESLRLKEYTSVDGNSVREKARILYEFYSECSREKDQKKKVFKASEGWLQSFIRRYDLKNLQITTRKPPAVETSTDAEAEAAPAPEPEPEPPEDPSKTINKFFAQEYEDFNKRLRNEENLREFLNEDDKEKPEKSPKPEKDGNDEDEEFEDDDEEEVEDVEKEPRVRPSYWTLENLTSVFEQAQMLKDMIMSYDPSLERSILITRAITADLDPLRHLFDEAAASFDHHFYQEMYDSEFWLKTTLEDRKSVV